MKISVVTISYNQAAYLRQCMDSVLSQNYPDIEYIVVDPGSTDGSREIIESYGDRVINIFEPDNGPADGLNKGFKRASGDIYFYLNSDDTINPGALMEAAETFRKNSLVDVLYGDCYIIDGAGCQLRKCYSDRFSLAAAAYRAAVVIQPSTFFRASAFLAVGGFNQDNRSNWDGELFIDFAIKGLRLLRVDYFFSNYRVHAQGITGSGRLAAIHREYGNRMFEKIKGRKVRKFDIFVALAFRLKKHLAHPQSMLERIKFGPIFGAKD